MRGGPIPARCARRRRCAGSSGTRGSSARAGGSRTRSACGRSRRCRAPALDAAAQLRRVLEIEINAAAENPLIDVDSGAVFHHGQFSTAYPPWRWTTSGRPCTTSRSSPRPGSATWWSRTSPACRRSSRRRPGGQLGRDDPGVRRARRAGPAAALGRPGHPRHRRSSPGGWRTTRASRPTPRAARWRPPPRTAPCSRASWWRRRGRCGWPARPRAAHVLAAAFVHVTAQLPDIRADHQLGDEIRIAEQLLDDLVGGQVGGHDLEGDVR